MLRMRAETFVAISTGFSTRFFPCTQNLEIRYEATYYSSDTDKGQIPIKHKFNKIIIPTGFWGSLRARVRLALARFLV